MNKTRKPIMMFISIMMICMFINFLPEYASKAQYQEMKITGSAFSNRDENVVNLCSSFSSDKARVIVLDYQGPNRELGCECDNTIYFQLYKTASSFSREVNIYETEHFDWKESRKIYLYLPKEENSNSSTKPSYGIRIVRDYSPEHNKGFFDPNKSYDPDGKHKDRFYINIGYYEVGEIGVDNARLKIGDSIKAKFQCNDYVGETKWRAENESIISVESNGAVTAVNSGTSVLIMSINGIDVFMRRKAKRRNTGRFTPSNRMARKKGSTM